MDKNYYYRVLGVKEGATAQQIKQGYEERVKRLKSPDYADDPDYVSKKLSEAAYAYRLLLGGAVPSDEKPHQKVATLSTAGNKLKKSTGKTLDRIADSKEAKSVLGVIFSLIIAVVSMVLGSCDSL